MKSALITFLALGVTAAFSPVTKADDDDEQHHVSQHQHHHRRHHSDYDQDRDYQHHRDDNGCWQLGKGFEPIKEQHITFRNEAAPTLGSPTNAVRLRNSAKRPIHFTWQDIQRGGPHHHLGAVARERNQGISISYGRPI